MEATIRAFLVILFLMVLSLPVSAGPPIERSFAKLTLGMTIEAFSKQYQAKERDERIFNLATGERLFEVASASLPKDLVVLAAKFLNNRLYRISAEYSKEYAERIRWEDLLTETAKKYGEVAVLSSSQGEKIVEIARWDDGVTTLILQRASKVRFESKKVKKIHAFSIVYMDDALWNERAAMEQEIF